MDNKFAVGKMVKLTTPGVNGPIKIAGTIKRILPGDLIEIKTQLHGYRVVSVAELEKFNQ